MQVNYMLLDSLVEQSTQGSFVSYGRRAIFAIVIRKLEHNGFVRGVGWGMGMGNTSDYLLIIALPQLVSPWNI